MSYNCRFRGMRIGAAPVLVMNTFTLKEYEALLTFAIIISKVRRYRSLFAKWSLRECPFLHAWISPQDQ